MYMYIIEATALPLGLAAVAQCLEEGLEPLRQLVQFQPEPGFFSRNSEGSTTEQLHAK